MQYAGQQDSFQSASDQEQSFAIVLWGWLRSFMPDYNGQKGELFAIEEVGNLLYGKQRNNHARSNPTDASSVPVSLKTQGQSFRNDLLLLESKPELQVAFREQIIPLAIRTEICILGLKWQC